MYRTYNTRPLPPSNPKRRSHGALLWALILLLFLVAVYILYATVRPLPAATTQITPPVMPGLVQVKVPWPSSAPGEQAAIGAVDYGLLARKFPGRPETPLPTASTAKVITALAVLEQKPLKNGEEGPRITLTERDVALYQQYVAKDGSVVPVAAGETITEYQALQAMMLPSANNIADTLATWAFGSIPAYTSYANGYVKKLGMQNTIVSDASGFSPATRSTPSDLVRLGNEVLKNPVFAGIVGQKTADFPGYGTMYNVNQLLGQSGIRGIKTGNTDEAGGCYLGAADISIGGKTITVVTAVMGAPTLGLAMRDTLPLINSAPAEFQPVHVIRAGQVVGRSNSQWGATAKIVAKQTINVTAWTGTAVAPKVQAKTVTAPAPSGTKAGTMSLVFNGQTLSTDLELGEPLESPNIWWRLSHPF